MTSPHAGRYRKRETETQTDLLYATGNKVTQKGSLKGQNYLRINTWHLQETLISIHNKLSYCVLSCCEMFRIQTAGSRAVARDVQADAKDTRQTRSSALKKVRHPRAASVERSRLEAAYFQARSENCEKWLLTSSCPSVCPHGTTRIPLNGFWWNLIFVLFSPKSVEKIQVPLKSDKNNA